MIYKSIQRFKHVNCNSVIIRMLVIIYSIQYILPLVERN